MVQIAGNNLCKRHQELNIKVIEAAAKKISLDDVISKTETSDVDRLFKIDLASKYKNVTYIIETLKSGDSLYISRALRKAVWIFTDEYSSVINTDYLHQNVFPFMSTKMKKKFLFTIALNVQNENVAAEFYNYVNDKFTNIAEKIILKTSESFKLNKIKETNLNIEMKNLQFFIGDSFILLEAYLENKNEWQRDTIVRQMLHLYSVDETKYLDLLEKHAKVNTRNNDWLGLRTSKDILKNHKNRILNNPNFYVNLLNVNKIVRHSKPDEVKVYINKLMPKKAEDFWSYRFYYNYKQIIEVIPSEERFTFFKKSFSEHYPSEEFEMSKMFYDQQYYKLMLPSEQESWALNHIANGKELLGPGCDYIWYKFVNFEKAFPEIKNYIKVTKDQIKRNDIVQILIDSSKDQRELEKLMKYYFERHVNEVKNIKEHFLRKIVSCKNVYQFDEDCWAAFDKILYSLKVYNTLSGGYNPEFKSVSLLYHILHGKELPEALVQYLDKDMSTYSLRPHIELLDNEKKNIIYDYILNFYLKRIEPFSPAPENLSELEEIKSKVSTYILYVLEFMTLYKKTKNDIPDIVMEFVNKDWKAYRYQQILANNNVINEQLLLKSLKSDANTLIDQLPRIKSAIRDNRSDFRMNTFLKKLKIYFSNDIGKQYLKFFNDLLLEKDLYRYVFSTAVFGIFQLGTQSDIIAFMKKYAPENAKIDYNNIDSSVLNIQEHICRLACYSRPSVPLDIMLMFLKGDYVRFCLPMFNMYLANLPRPLFMKFVESIIDTPVSIQKHGLRLALKCFSNEDLTKLILETWEQTKNVSLRSVIYRVFFDKAIKENSRQLFDVLKKLTLDLHEDDDDEVFNALTLNKLCDEYLCEFIEVVWKAVDALSNKKSNLQRKAKVVTWINNNISLLKKETIQAMVNDHVKLLLKDIHIDSDSDKSELIEAQLTIVAHYIVYFTNTEMDCNENIELIKFILKHCTESWNDVVKDSYIVRFHFWLFFDKLIDESYRLDDARNCRYSFVEANVIFENVLSELKNTLPLYETYIYQWRLRLLLIHRKLLDLGRKSENFNKLEVLSHSAQNFGEEVGHLIKEYVEKNEYYTYFFDEMTSFLANYIVDFASFIHEDGNVNSTNVLLMVCRGLLESQCAEARMFALELLPDDLDESNPEYIQTGLKSLVENIRENADTEIKCCIYKKYYSDCKRRRFI